MTHVLHLKAAPFEQIKRGVKTVELRLNDEKRRRIKVGDRMILLHTENPLCYLFAEVIALHRFDTFAELFETVDPRRCGFEEGEPLSMRAYYSEEREKAYGVLGIEFRLQNRAHFPSSPLADDAGKIIKAVLQAAMPDTAVQKALEHLPQTEGRLLLVAVGKAAWQMAYAAYGILGERIDGGIVITKHGYAGGAIGNLRIREAGHPVPDEDTYRATEEALCLTSNLTEKDRVLFLLSGGGSALFEKPLLPAEEMADITKQLLASGADITEINTIRKRLSAVKGGRFAEHIAPAGIFSVILSDVLGDAPDMIASGPAYPDSSTSETAVSVAKTYGLSLSARAGELLHIETPKTLTGIETHITGSVRVLCETAKTVCEELGYRTHVLTDRLCCEAREAGSLLGSVAKSHAGRGRQAFLLGGETVVKLTGSGLGGRNQELALASAKGLDGLQALVFSLGSDGTDGPTDAAGGIADGSTATRLREAGIDLAQVLSDNDAYHALQAVGGLLFTGPTGTNVNDLTVLLLDA